jgi:uncharacterized protein (TIGR02118 family)
MSFLIRRLPGMEVAAFRSYWSEVHGPLVARHAEALGLQRYVQVHTASDGVSSAMMAARGDGEPYDGIAEIWYSDRQALIAPARTEAGRAAMQELRDDEARFIDLGRSVLCVGDEHVVVAGPGA